MKYFDARSGAEGESEGTSDNDPLSGVANLFETGLVFVVSLLLALFSTYGMQDVFNEKSTFTMMKKGANGQLEIITKKGRKIEAVKVTGDAASGKGARLGVAYQLEDGSMVYVPEGTAPGEAGSRQGAGTRQ